MVLATSQQEFSDAEFRVVDNGDQSKKLAFEVSGIATATTRTWTVPDSDVTVSTFAATFLDDANAATVLATLGAQPLDADLTSWAAITRASGFDTFATTPSSANLAALLTDETGTAGTIPFLQSGTWSPSLGGTTTYTTQSGRYSKNGSIVLATGRLTINAIGTGSTNVVSGLPFSATGFGVAIIGYFGAASSNRLWMGGYIINGGTSFTLTGTTAAAASATDAFATFQNGTDLIFAAIYNS